MRLSQHRIIALNEFSHGSAVQEAPVVSRDDIAYLLFTSGSTGEPKGVPVSQGNVQAYISFVSRHYVILPEDRVSQNFDLTFDLSVHDMFVCWNAGACLYCVPENSVMAPAKFIRDNKLSIWFSVPSVVMFMSRLGLLRVGALESLRYSLFCGEALPEASVKSWERAAPNSHIENLYGPTEATIAFTRYVWDRQRSPGQCRNGVVPIGRPFDSQMICIIDKSGDVLPSGKSGELCLAGSQVTRGYWQDPDKTRAAFVKIKGKGETTWYRTGDVAVEGDDGCLFYLGRMDSQVKIRGYRVELQEIEFALRQVAGTEQVVSMAWPVRDGHAEGIVAFICGAECEDEKRILAQCQRTLPEYMVPRSVYFVQEMPLNPNGKIDRKKLASTLGDDSQ